MALFYLFNLYYLGAFCNFPPPKSDLILVSQRLPRFPLMSKPLRERLVQKMQFYKNRLEPPLICAHSLPESTDMTCLLSLRDKGTQMWKDLYQELLTERLKLSGFAYILPCG